jgi:hypothetical protein
MANRSKHFEYTMNGKCCQALCQENLMHPAGAEPLSGKDLVLASCTPDPTVESQTGRESAHHLKHGTCG